MLTNHEKDIFGNVYRNKRVFITGLTGFKGSWLAAWLLKLGAEVSGYSLSTTVRQLLYDFDHTRDLVRQAEAGERVARAGLTRAQSDLVFSVKQAFYEYAQTRRLVGVSEENLARRTGTAATACTARTASRPISSPSRS